MTEMMKQNVRSNPKNFQNSKPTSTRPHGKSRFAQKSRGNPKKPVAVKRGPVNVYLSVCCGLPAVKPACVRVDKKKALEQGLGSWRCSGCHKAAKVTVGKPKASETITVQAPAMNGVPMGDPVEVGSA
jgi:hypothetical protein